MLNNLSFLEQKIHQVQDVVRWILTQKSHLSVLPNELAAQQQLVTTDLTSIIVDLISTAGSLLPSIKNSLASSNPPPEQLHSNFSSSASPEPDALPPKKEKTHLGKDELSTELNDLSKCFADCCEELNDSVHLDDVLEADHLAPGSYEVLQLDKDEILAPHPHFCAICGKGFKRDANLRMHMRGHGDEYKTPAALAKPKKDSELPVAKRYSCPFVGCKRNREHKSFQPLKTLLCVKNHYKRSHCEKSYTCGRCGAKKFSVLADLKTHEKHCGRDRWLCSCGTTFSRKDKLFGHVALFQGHAPSLPAEEGCGGNDHGVGLAAESSGNSYNTSAKGIDVDAMETKASEGERAYLSALRFEPYEYGVSDEFMEAAFGLLENSSGLCSSAFPNFQ
ncbi:hypothetical protein HPP92_004398 [Vanilla planifolia]|uniref:C2H2-type domain-containing protein n=1 Tax=Vanilla planifolia TaxID=51239 RepID=A0A835S8Z2_VANPL|nr:hypothetical protein HPP92_004398 [Vanilla planifolia]